ncbi:hypothetical protein QZH41_013263 [Actinostola sp. cb2023]|nr:hypothetical protein QZH41_013263 [Actinostola sp. cb2023]
MASKRAKNTTTEANQKPELGRKRKPPRSLAQDDDDLFSYGNKVELTFSYSTKNTKTILPVESSDEEDEERVGDDPEFTRNSEDEEEDEFADDSQESLHITDSEDSIVETSLSTSHNRSPSPPPPPSQADMLRVQRQLRAKNKKTREFDTAFSLLKQTVEADSYCAITTRGKQASGIINLDDSPSPIVSRNRAQRKMTVKVRTRSGIKRFNMKAGDKFEVVIKDLASDQNVSVENILLSINNQNILPEDTPLSKGVTVADIIECIIMESCPDVDEENLIEIKVQGIDAASRKAFSVSKTKPLESLFVEYSKFRNMERSKLKFLFDGDSLEGNETPEELDMEDENVIDVRVL